MPVIHDSQGRYAYVPNTHLFVERPEDFLDAKTYEKRIEIARRTVLDVVLHLQHGSRPNDTVYLDSDLADDLADFVDGQDGRRAWRARANNRAGKQHFANHYRIRSPQSMAKRRRRLFSFDDTDVSPKTARERDYDLLDMMRWHLIHEAIQQMIHNHELWFMDGIWQVRPSAMDIHRGCGGPVRLRKHGVKHDDRSFHGRPNRDRGRVAA